MKLKSVRATTELQTDECVLPKKKIKRSSPAHHHKEGTVVRAVAVVRTESLQLLIEEVKRLSTEVELKMVNKEEKKLFEAELKRVQQYAVDVTLDPDSKILNHPV
ncbi:E3 ubiquitin-protein ligase TRIM21-like protein [Lates japonicus]|uniref:E3 ubiquitin-protein ligase TRIM21-like protein n=1 Tax=Lates japonicus TaxID=270547 RepID=A0AAD3NAF9_LATJO|nr:E3 ubiquitin-protein ligase TRIM21-like protein [Lates japonicus]